MKPSRSRIHLPAACALFDTALGPCGVVWGPDGLRGVQLPATTRAEARQRLTEHHGPVRPEQPPAAVRRAVRRLVRHLAGKPQRYEDIPLDMAGIPPFHQRVYRALQQVGPGETVSYATLAARAGSPRAARAVGQALARNPFAVIVPCHRVLAADGGAGGFSAPGGIATKTRLLGLEGVALSPPETAAAGQPLFGGSARIGFDAARAVTTLRRADAKLGRLMAQVGPFRLKLKRPRSTFVALAEAIVYQQLTAKAARSIYARLEANVGDRATLVPEHILSVPPARLRAVGLSRPKIAALQDLARQTLAARVPSLAKLRRMDDEAIIETLTAVRGIGRWTVQMLLIFQLGRPDVLPASDYGIRKGFARCLGRSIDPPPPAAEVEAHGERWRPFRTVASWYLWRALELPAV